jgi:predicted Rossmann fold nucleotide-binding protein DprA/Smf involved in DNA uptake
VANFPETVYWLALAQSSGLKLNVIKPIVLRWCVADRRPLSELFTLSELELSTTFGLANGDAERLLQAADQLDAQAKLLAQWKKEGIETIIRTEGRYPQRLVYHLPPVAQPLILWAQGNLNLLNQPGVTMLGQPGSTESAVEFVDELISTLEAEQIGLVSGYSRGLDRTTFDMMLASERGFTVAMLPMGLSAFAKTTNKLMPAVYSNRTALVSPFAPNTPYQDKLADARNLLIDHLALALLILECDEESQARAVAAIDRDLPVLVRENTPLNRDLLGSGAVLLTDPEEVLDLVQQVLVDDAIQKANEAPPPEEIAAAPLTATAPTAADVSDDDYSLRTETVPPIDSEEALTLLGLGGEVPEVLRRKLEDSAETDD